MASMLQNKRSTRGLRMTEMVGEAAEEDALFWNDNVWAEEESDESFSEEEAKPDEFDTDFGESESDDDDDGGSDEEAARKMDAKSRKRSNKYVEPPKTKRRATVSVVVEKNGGKSTTSAVGAWTGVDTVSAGVNKNINSTLEPRVRVQIDRAYNVTERTVRATTKMKTEDADKTREKERRKLAQRRRESGKQPVNRQTKGSFDQKEQLLEAVQTAELNNKWLIKQKQVEEEKAASSNRVVKSAEVQDKVTFLSRRGACNVITFSSVECFPLVLSGAAASRPPCPPAPPLCVITGRPARYRDPQTMLPYADVAAYKELCAKYHNKVILG